MNRDQAIEAFRLAHPAEFRWIMDNKGANGFARAMLQRAASPAGLTANMMAAVQRAIAQKPAAISIDKIETALRTAKSNGVEHPKLRLEAFTFSLAKAGGKNDGAIYVKAGDDYLGKIMGGRLSASQLCGAERQAAIIAAAADPEAAAEAYGKRTGVCSCCGRRLTAKESVKRSIGPICAEKFGW